MTMTYDEFKLYGYEEFNEFRYFKGEKENPYDTKDRYTQSLWWSFEQRYYDVYSKTGEWKSFEHFLNTWITERAAPETGWDLRNGNPWKDEYEANSDYKTN